jgi:uncharacterized membrane protein YgaE (UPF0421/DUF939 family)
MITVLIGIMTAIFIITLILIRKEYLRKIDENITYYMERYNADLTFEIEMLDEIIEDLKKHIDILYNRQLKEKWTKKLIELEEIRDLTNSTK